jgi:hypothetical protein
MGLLYESDKTAEVNSISFITLVNFSFHVLDKKNHKMCPYHMTFLFKKLMHMRQDSLSQV